MYCRHERVRVGGSLSEARYKSSEHRAQGIFFETAFYREALDRALATSTPEIFNTDQGAQFTSQEFTTRVLQSGARMSMDGRGRALPHIRHMLIFGSKNTKLRVILDDPY